MKHLLIFTRYPVPGHAKTRLIPELGLGPAARLQRQMTGYTLLHARRLGGDPCVRVLFEGGSRRKMRRWLGTDPEYAPQPPGDLGHRLDAASADAFARGATAVAIIGSDCPGVTADLLRDAYAALEQHDLVLGPAADGGYYLIASRQPRPELFRGMAWGTETVLRETLRVAERSGLSVGWLPPLADVDRPEDLDTWRVTAGVPGTGSAIVGRATTAHSGAALNEEVLATRVACLVFPRHYIGEPVLGVRVLEEALSSDKVSAAVLHAFRRGRRPLFPAPGRWLALGVRRESSLEVGGFCERAPNLHRDLLRRLRRVGKVRYVRT